MATAAITDDAVAALRRRIGIAQPHPENQRGEITTAGHATILLPSREHGAAQLPDLPARAGTTQAVLDALVERFAETENRS